MRAHSDEQAAHQKNADGDGDLIASLQFIATPHPASGVTGDSLTLNAGVNVVAPKRQGGGTNGILAFNALLA
jgi:hypothetical protein